MKPTWKTRLKDAACAVGEFLVELAGDVMDGLAWFFTLEWLDDLFD